MIDAKRNVDGILLLDKPSGITSNAALQRVKRLYNARKAGHTGSLDPLASGLLPVCLGEATKISGFLLDADKRYRFVCRLGVTTTTGDAEGDIIARRPVVSYTREQIDAVLQRFIGEIEQIPPMFSAVKYQGKRLYKLARQGQTVERPPRKVFIHELTLLDRQNDWLECSVSCSKGTYIRTLAEDIGQSLGCGAHIVQLRRTGVTPYDSSKMIAFDVLETLSKHNTAAIDDLLLPVDTALSTWPALQVSATIAYSLRNGQVVTVTTTPANGWVRLYESNNHFFGIGESLGAGKIAPRRLMQTRN